MEDRQTTLTSMNTTLKEVPGGGEGRAEGTISLGLQLSGRTSMAPSSGQGRTMKVNNRSSVVYLGDHDVLATDVDKVVAGGGSKGTEHESDLLTGLLYEERAEDTPRLSTTTRMYERRYDTHRLSCSHDDPYCMCYA